MKRTFHCLALAATLATVGAANAAAQSASVDCSTAKSDIARLQHEKQSTDERKIKGVMSIMPIGIAINAVGSAAEPSKEMHIDDYNKKLDERISEIKAACKV